jgi:hypothetical protein
MIVKFFDQFDPVLKTAGKLQMNPENIFCDERHRRWWLLIKALEDAPLEAALRLAQAADEFLIGVGNGGTRKQAVGTLLRAQGTAAAAVEVEASQVASGDDLEGCSVPPAKPDTEEEGGQNGSAPQAAHRPIDPLPLREVSKDLLPIGGNEAGGTLSVSTTEDTGLAIWASVDDVVRFLRQHDDVVVASGEGTFLVNGRFSEDLDTLVARANRARARQRKPPFQLASPIIEGRPRDSDNYAPKIPMSGARAS